MELDESARNFLLDKGFDQAFGARPLRRAIENHLESPLAEALLSGDLGSSPKLITGSCEGEKLVFAASRKKRAPRAEQP